MNFLDSDLERYVQQHSEQEPELLQQLARETHLKILQPRMLSASTYNEGILTPRGLEVKFFNTLETLLKLFLISPVRLIWFSLMLTKNSILCILI